MGSLLSLPRRAYRSYAYSPFYWRFMFRAPPLDHINAEGNQVAKCEKIVYAPDKLYLTFTPSKDIQAHGVALYLHAPQYCVDDLYDELQRLADRTGYVVLAWEYPGYGTQRRSLAPQPGRSFLGYAVTAATPANRMDWKPIEVPFSHLCNEVLQLWDQMNSDGRLYDSQWPRVILTSGMASCFAFHILSERPKARIDQVFLHDPWSRWDDFYYSRKFYWPLWMWEPRLFDSIEVVQQKISPDTFKGRRIVVCIGKLNNVMPYLGGGGELLHALETQFGEDMMQLDQPDASSRLLRIHCHLMPHWDQHVPFKRVVQAFFIRELSRDQ